MSNFLISAREIYNRYIARTENKSQGRYTYGLKDDMPKQMIELIAGNPTAMRAILKKAEYIVAKGFKNEALNDFIVTQGKSAYKLLCETAIQYAIFECVTWHIARRADNKIGSVDIHPFEMCRKRIDGNIDYNPTLLSQQEKLNDYRTYPLFKPTNKIEKGYKGEILYHWNKTPMSFNFPVASWFSGEYTIKTGSELALMDLELVENGFMPSAILTYIGHLDDTKKDDGSLTQKERFKQVTDKWTSKSKDPSTGKSLRYSLLILNAESKEQVAQLETVDIEGVITGSIEKKVAVDKDTCRAINVNPVLLNFDAETFFSSGDAMKNIKANMADSVLDAQALIKEVFEMVYPEQKWDLTTLNPYVSVVEKNENQKILDTLNSLSPLLAAEIVRNMPPEKLLEIVGINANQQ